MPPLWERRSLLRGICQGGAVARALVQRTKSDWASTTPPRGPAPCPPWLCTVSVRESSLGEMHICIGPEASCVPVRSCQGSPWSGRKTASNGMCSGRQIDLPECRRTISQSAGPSQGGVAILPEGRADVRARWQHDWARLGYERPQSDLRCFWLQKKRWRMSSGMRQWSHCCLYGPVHACRVAVVWSGAEQAILLATQGSWYATAAKALSRARQLHAHCTWLPSPWQRHLLIQQHAWTLALAVLMP